jgi:anti-sigma B factor antagonist
LAALSEHTIKLIKISQLDSVLNILTTIEEAIDAAFMHEIEKDLKDDDSDVD